MSPDEPAYSWHCSTTQPISDQSIGGQGTHANAMKLGCAELSNKSASEVIDRRWTARHFLLPIIVIRMEMCSIPKSPPSHWIAFGGQLSRFLPTSSIASTPCTCIPNYEGSWHRARRMTSSVSCRKSADTIRSSRLSQQR